MVLERIQRFSGGADGTNITGPNSGSGTSGDALEFITKNSGTDITALGDPCFQYSAAAAIEGSTGARWSTVGITNNTYAGWFIPTGHGKRAMLRFPFILPAIPTGAAQPISRIDTPSTSSQIKVNTAGKLTISTTAAGDIVASTSTNPLTVGTLYWIEQDLIAGTTTSNGTVAYRVYTNSKTDGTGVDTPVAGLSYSSAVQNTGTDADVGGATSRWRFYNMLASSGVTGLNTDLWRGRVTNDLTATTLGPYIPSIPPSGTGTQSGAVKILTVTASGGTQPYSFTWTQTSGPAGTATAIPGNPNMVAVPIPDNTPSVWQALITDDNANVSAPIVFNVAASTGGTPAMTRKTYGPSGWA